MKQTLSVIVAGAILTFTAGAQNPPVEPHYDKRKRI
jgi:hypothetical protein